MVRSCPDLVRCLCDVADQARPQIAEHWKVAHKSPPNTLRCSIIVPERGLCKFSKLSQFGPESAVFGQVRPSSAQNCPCLAKFDPDWARAGQIRAKLDQSRPRLARVRPTLARIRPNYARNQPDSANLGPDSVPLCSTLAQIRSNAGPMSAESGQNFAGASPNLVEPTQNLTGPLAMGSVPQRERASGGIIVQHCRSECDARARAHCTPMGSGSGAGCRVGTSPVGVRGLSSGRPEHCF